MIKFKRQGGGSTSSAPASAPSSLAYGEPAVSSDGTFYVGSGSGGVVSKVKNAEKASNADYATNASKATNATNATNAANATNADNALNGLWEFYGTCYVSSWTSTGSSYYQDVTVKPAYGSKTMTSSARLSSPMTTQTTNYDTNQEKLEALSIINAGSCTPSSGKVRIQCQEKPQCDIDVHWYVKI